MYTYDVSRMPRYTLFSLYHYITSTCQSLYSQYAQALYSVLVWYRLSSKSNKSGTVNLTNYFFIFMNQDGPRSLTLSTIIMTSFCHIYIAHPRSTNRVTILHHTSTNRVTILRPTHNNNNILPSVFLLSHKFILFDLNCFKFLPKYYVSAPHYIRWMQPTSTSSESKIYHFYSSWSNYLSHRSFLD